MRSTHVFTAVRWFSGLRGLAPGWLGALLVGLLAAAGPGDASGDLVVANGALVPANDILVYQLNPVSLDSRVVVEFPSVLIIQPVGIAVPASVFVPDLFVLDSIGKVIRVNPVSGAQTTVSLGQRFKAPLGIAVAPDGDLLVVDAACCDGGHGGVIRVKPVDGTQTVVSQGSLFAEPTGIAIAANGDLFVVNRFPFSHSVLSVNPVDGTPAPVSGHGTFVAPAGIAMGIHDNLYVVDSQCFCEGSGVVEVTPVGG